jgi:ribosomal protein S18 acetylase RimI-like enzyme
LTITLRTFIFPDDYEEVYRLWRESGDGIQLRHSDEPQEIEKKIQRDPELFILAENGDEIVGAVLGGYDGRRGLMYHLAVKQAYRRMGVGELLQSELEKRLRDKGCTRYYLLVTPDNDVAIRFYENRGWEQLNLRVYAKDLIG